jgi:rubrerythrin
MRCREKGHGCLFVAAINKEENKWTWQCPSCGVSMELAPGVWVNPPDW